MNAIFIEMGKAQSEFRRIRKVDLTRLDDLRNIIKNMRSDFLIGDYNKLKNSSNAAKKIQFVLRYFLALNKTAYSKVPSLEEAIKIHTKLGTVSSDISLIFGGNDNDYTLFSNFESQLRYQIQTRLKMKKTLGRDPGLKPGKSDVKNWFRALKLNNSSNKVVIEAYLNFARGFFIHRHEPDPTLALAKQTLASIFTSPTTLSGARLTVCSGYAVLGKALLVEAGAKFQRYYIGLRASDYQIKCSSSFSDVHAIAYLTRIDPMTKKIWNIYVSNDDIVFKEDDGLGPMAVAWKDKSNPIYKGKGKTLIRATKNATNKITARRKTLRKISCK